MRVMTASCWSSIGRISSRHAVLKRRRTSSSSSWMAMCWMAYSATTCHSFVPNDLLWTRPTLKFQHCYYSTTTTIQSRQQQDEDFLSSSISNLPRLYVPDSQQPQWTCHTIVPLSANQANYLTVMRITNVKRWGSLAGHLRIFNGNHGEWLAKVVVLNDSESSMKKKPRKSSGDATVVECVQCLREQPPTQSSNIHLHMGRLKKQRRKWVLEKVTELGVESIHVVDTEYSSVDAWEYDKHSLQIVEAAEQCERLTLPQLSETPDSWTLLLDQIQMDAASTTCRWLICRERSPESLPLWQALSQTSPINDYHVLVGPEGGWSPTELVQLEELRQQSPNNIQFVSLGSLVLRAETAAIAAVSAVALAQDSHNHLEDDPKQD